MDTDYEVDPEGNSIDTQRKVTSAKEREMSLVNVGEYVEPGNSAQTIDKRPVFREMIARIQPERDDAPMSGQGIRVAFSWSHFWVLKRMADGAVCWVADKTGKVHSGEGKLL